MKIIPLDQRSEIWKTWRKDGIGASESAAILGMSRYKTPLQLWEEKTERAFPQFINTDMQRGIDLEEQARHEFQMLIGKMFFPVCGEHDKYPVIKASFDGITGDQKEFVEIKCPRTTKLADAIATNNQEVIKKHFPEYYCQVQHQFAVSEKSEKGYIASYQNEELNYMEIKKDEEFIKERLIPEILQFWLKHVKSDIEPSMGRGDYIYIDDEDTVKTADEWRNINSQIKELQKREKDLRNDLIEKGDDGNAIIGNIVKMTRCSSTQVDYKKACQDNEINVEPYKKFTIGYYRFMAI